MCIFLQPPRKTIQNESYFCQIPTCMQADDPTEIRMFDPFTDKHQIGTMNKEQKTLANQGIGRINSEHTAVRQCLKATGACFGSIKRMLLLTPCLLMYQGADVYQSDVNMGRVQSIINNHGGDAIISCVDSESEPPCGWANYFKALENAVDEGKACCSLW